MKALTANRLDDGEVVFLSRGRWVERFPEADLFDDDEAALADLCKLPGVGEKVANCVLLFAYGRLRAFPIDVWIERVLREMYFKGKRKVTVEKLKRFSSEYFGPYGGYAQQYLFHHARKTYRSASNS